jgi:predicted Fe-Mo cluster-binding NifX family protein
MTQTSAIDGGRSLFALCVDRDDSHARLDESFGHCRFFAIYRGDGTLRGFSPNPTAAQPETSAIKAVNYLTRQHVRSVVATQFGQKALEYLAFAGIVPLVCHAGDSLHLVAASFLRGQLKQP